MTDTFPNITGETAEEAQQAEDNLTEPTPAIREPVDVSNSALATDWLLLEIGTKALSGMFLRGDQVVHAPMIGEEGYRPPKNDNDHNGPAQVRVVDETRLAARISVEYAPYHWKRPRNADPYQEEMLFPTAAARTVLHATDKAINLRRLRGVIHTPIPRPDGTLLTTPGYDQETRLLLLPNVEVPPVPERPTENDLSHAVELLRHLIAEFVWVGEHDEANFLGLLLTPLLRELCPPPYKLGAIMARQPGSGKSLLAELVRIVHGGVFRTEMPGEEPELRKQITSILTQTTAPVITFDNVGGMLKSSTLAGLLTSAEYSDRPLGATANVTAVNDRLWTITGNNLNIGGDLVRRTTWISIDPRVPNPERRTGFAIENLAEHVSKNRGEILRALLILVAAWREAGSPAAASTSSDCYARWISVVRGILSHAGIPGRFDDPDSAQQSIGSEDDEWKEFLEAIYTSFGSQTWSTKTLLARVNDAGSMAPVRDDVQTLHEGPPLIPLDTIPTFLADKIKPNTGVGGIGRSLGWALTNRNGRYAGRIVCRAAGDASGQKLWTVERLDS